MTKLVLLFTALVLVPTASPGQSRGGDTTPRRKVYYDITVTGEFDFQGQHFVPGDPNNMFNLKGRWIPVGTTKRSVARWQKVGFQIYYASSPNKPSGASLINPASGTIQVSGSPELGNPTDKCKWDGATVTYKNVDLNIGFRLKHNQLDNGILFSVNRPEYSDTQKTSGCATSSGLSPWGSHWGWPGGSVTLPNKIKFFPSSPVSSWTAADAGTVPFPLDQILAGRSFVIETGTQRSANEKAGTRQQFSQRIEFTARKPEQCTGLGPIADKDVVEHETVDVRAVHPEIEPNGSTDVEIKVTCDGTPVKDVKVEVMVKVKDESGYHIHSGDRPRGKLNGKVLTPADSGPALWKPDTDVTTDEKGKATLKFESPLARHPNGNAWIAQSKNGAYAIGIAGVYEVAAKPTRFSESNGTGEITAKVKDLAPLAMSQYLELSGKTDTHRLNHWGTAGTLQAFTKLALDFHFAQVAHNTTLTNCKMDLTDLWAVTSLSVNDIALPWGGVLDVDQERWHPSHQTHNKGEGGDFDRFGAGPNDQVMQLGSGKACNGDTYDIEIALQHLLLALGPKYGHWDCSDLQLASACTPSDIPPYPKMPHRLHLHVGD